MPPGATRRHLSDLEDQFPACFDIVFSFNIPALVPHFEKGVIRSSGVKLSPMP